MKTNAHELLALMQARELARGELETEKLTLMVREALGPRGLNDDPAWRRAVEWFWVAAAERTTVVPFKFEGNPDARGMRLLVRLNDVLREARADPELRRELSGKGIVWFRRAVLNGGLVALDGDGNAVEFERTLQGRRVAHMVALLPPDGAPLPTVAEVPGSAPVDA